VDNIEKIRQEERQVAYRPTRYAKWMYYDPADEDEDGYNDHGNDCGECPNCESFVESSHYRHYCGWCGQKLEWDEDCRI
jgi:hypothetical protein